MNLLTFINIFSTVFFKHLLLVNVYKQFGCSFHFIFFFLQLPLAFYGNRTSRPRWIAPTNGEDSEIEVEDEDLDFDDDVVDPDFLLHDTDDISPSSSGE